MLNNEEKVLKAWSERHILNMTRYLYKENNKRDFIIAPHLIKIGNSLMDVINGKIKRLIINVPPRYGKTEVAVKNFIAYGLSINPQSKFIHLSYSDSLALDNSSQAKEYIQSEAYQRFWSMNLKKDAQSKSKWFNDYGGGCYATSAGGAITGFGAGVTGSKSFSGAIIIDDPLKPDDSFSDVKRKTVNERYNNTIRSRVNDLETGDNDFKTPIIVIMQRLHEDDLSGYLLDGGSGEDWTHLCLPAINKDNTPLWKEKHTLKELEDIRKSNSYVFSGQYMQTPSPDEGGEWKRNSFEIVTEKEIPSNIRYTMYIDGAYTKNTANDPTGILIAGKHNNNIYIHSSIDKYLEMPELIKYIPQHISASGVDVKILKVEPKASGKSIAQTIRSQTNLNIQEIKTDFVSMSKIERARASSPFIDGERVKLVKGNWNDAYLNQVSMFPNAKHDEHVDLTAYAIEDLLMNDNRIEIR